MFVSQTALRRSLIALLLIVLSVSMIGATEAKPFPNVIQLPNGFQPEGIDIGNGTTFYVGSIPTGAVYRGDLRTGQGAILVPPHPGRAAIGLKFDPRTGYLFVAGGPTGYAFIYNGQTGADIDHGQIQLTTLTSFINDVIVTKNAAYFTNSSQPELYRVPLEHDGEPLGTSETIPLTGDYVFTPGQLNANGIAATPNGKTLIIVNTIDGALYKVDPMTGVATRIDLGGKAVPNGDGILLQGKTLYVVQNFLNQIAVIKLSPDYTSGTIVDTITRDSAPFRIPTTIARFRDALYAVNARFDTPPTPTTDYDVVRVPIK